MTLAEMLRAKQEADRRALNEVLAVEPDAFTAEQEARAVELTDAINSRQTAIAEAEAAQQREAASNAAAVEHGEAGRPAERAATVVTREERTYTQRSDSMGQRSFFTDAFNAQRGDMGAASRLQRHMREVEVEGEAVQERDGEQRATTTSSYGGLVVPQYLVELAAAVVRAGRPTANLCTGLELPEQGMVFDVPRGTTGAAVASQNGQNTNVQNTDEVWTDLTINVVTIAGQQDVSRQSLERGTPGIDQLTYLDLAAAYAAELDRQVIAGSGASGQMLGILNTAGIGSAAAFGAAATAANVWLKGAGAINNVETLRFLPPNVTIMHPRRWNWLTTLFDSSNRPLVVPNGNGAFNALGVYDSPEMGRVVGTFQSLPVVTDANSPTNLGTNSEDAVITVRSSDLLLWEVGDGMPRQLRFEQTLGGQLTVKLVVYNYAAFTAGRYPTAVSKFGGADTTAGNGLIAPTF